MRIIAGEFGGRRLGAPPGDGTRPMLDRVREAVFSTLGDRVVGARVLDLFAGTGSLGLEALSRGAARVRMFERDRRMAAVLRANIAALGVEDRTDVLVHDALDERRWGEDPYELLFLDPPYAMVRDGPARRRVLGALETWLRAHAAPGALAVLHVPRYALSAREFPAGTATEERVYGTNAIWYVERADESGGAA